MILSVSRLIQLNNVCMYIAKLANNEKLLVFCL